MKHKINNIDKVGVLFDNFEEKDFNYVVAMRRWKDNQKDQIYPENSPNVFGWAKYISGWSCFNEAQLLSFSQEIICTCEENNARAYITINKRNLDLVKEYADRLKKNGLRPGYEFLYSAIVPRMFNDEFYNWGDLNPRVLVDVDVDDESAFPKVLKTFEKFGEQPVLSTLSPNGGLNLVMDERGCCGLMDNFKWLDDYQFYSEGGYPDIENPNKIEVMPDIPFIIYANLQ